MEPDSLLRALADGEPHSGEDLARAFGVTRAAVWKQIGKLERWGLYVNAVPGLGYRLQRRIDLLDVESLRGCLHSDVAGRIGRLELFTEVPSTNRHLLDQEPPSPGELDVCIAEYQSAGRGRRGRRWNTPLGGGLCLSVAAQFVDNPPELSALTLAVGVVVRRVIERVSGVRISLKWPNDLVWDERKLGGILLELKGEAQGGCHVVTGIGLNVALPPQVLATLSDWPRGAVDLASATNGAPPARAALTAALIADLAELFAGYPTNGFSPYRAEWRAADCLKGRRVTFDDAAGPVIGTALGIEADGALLIETAAGARRRVISGDVSVRSS
ncbi:MAG TPA: biotin--[acetyl-CoA-carboxylase] ligase [Gammaproteobacteria bacterium]|nr:biotin--[acetyl-CoA-carboxylase] ligase [Gammaproteobacteria bacterium]